MRTFTGFRTAVAIVAICGSAMVFPALAAATPITLYVAGAGGVGIGAATDVSNNCQTEDAPCATLAYAVSLAASGDTIEISGTLSEHAATPLA